MNLNKKLIEEIKSQLHLMNYQKDKTLSEQITLNEDNFITRAWDKLVGNEDEESAAVYKDLNEKPYDWNIAKYIREADQVNDRECWAQFAFNKITNKEMYYNVGKYLRYDPINFLEDYLDIDDNPCGMKGVQKIKNKWNSLGSIRYPYTLLRENPSPSNIVKILLESKGQGTENDREAWAQSALNAIKDKETYLEVTRQLNDDPLRYAEFEIGMDPNEDYHKGSFGTINTIKSLKSKFKVSYPYDVLKENPSESLIANVIEQSYSRIGNDKEAWAQAAFNAMKLDGKFSGIVYRGVSKILKADTYHWIKRFIDTSEDHIKCCGSQTIDKVYSQLVKNDDLNTFYDFTVGSAGMYRLLETQRATAEYVGKVLSSSNSLNSDYSSTLGLRILNDCESCVVAAFMAIPNQVFYKQVGYYLGDFRKPIDQRNYGQNYLDPLEWAKSFMDIDEKYHSNTSVKDQYDRIMNTKTLNLKQESPEILQKAIKEITEKGFGDLTNYDDCKTVNQIYYKAHIFGFKKIMESMKQKRDSIYKSSFFSTTDFFSTDIGDLSENNFLISKNKEILLETESVTKSVDSKTSSITTYWGYPNCLNVSNIQLGPTDQDVSEEIKVTVPNYSTESQLLEETYQRIVTFMSPKDVQWIDKNDPNKGDAYSENTFILIDFVKNWQSIFNNYESHFSMKNTLEDSLFPQGPVKFFEYWFDTTLYKTALSRSLVDGPKIFCQAGKLKSEGSLKKGFEGALDEMKDQLHILLPIASVALMFTPGGWAGVFLSMGVELADAAIYKYIDEDPYMAGLALLFAFVGPLDEGLGYLIRMKAVDRALLAISKKFATKQTKALTKEEFLALRSTLSRAPRLKRLAMKSMYNKYLEKLYTNAIKKGAPGWIKTLAWLYDKQVSLRSFISKMGIIVGGSFMTWDFIAKRYYGMCNPFPFEDVSKQMTKEPGVHWWITEVFISGLAKTQPFTEKCPENEIPNKNDYEAIKQISLLAIKNDFDQLIKSNVKIGIDTPPRSIIFSIQTLLEYLKLNKTFTISSYDKSKSNFFSDLLNTSNSDLSDYVLKLLSGPGKKECTQTITNMQINPTSKLKKNGPYNVAFHFSKDSRPDSKFYTVGQSVQIKNTNFDGIYKITEIHTKEGKIFAINLDIPYKPVYQKNKKYDETFKNRALIKPEKLKVECLPSKEQKIINFDPGVFDDNMKQAVMNYQVLKKLPITGIIDNITLQNMKDDFTDKEKNILGNSFYQSKILSEKNVLLFEKVKNEYDKKIESDLKKLSQNKKEIDNKTKDKETMKNQIDALKKAEDNIVNDMENFDFVLPPNDIYN
jgi:hypothetical protein